MRVVRVLAPNPSIYTLEGTNTWIVGDAPAIVIDPGPDDADHLAEVERAAGRIGAVVVTHEHPDHMPGAPSLAGRTGAPLFAYRPPPGAERLRDGQVVAFGGASLVAIHTPGHTPDHFVFFAREEALLFTGDAVLGRGTSVLDPPEGDLTAYLRSLRRMLELRPRIIYPGHGPVVFDAPGKLREYVEHRLERQNEVLTALGSDGARPRTAAELVPEIYADHPSDVHPLAERSVLAHLLKLEAEGRVQRSGTAAEPRFAASTPRSCERCGRPVKTRARLCGPCSLAVLQQGSAE